MIFIVIALALFVVFVVAQSFALASRLREAM
jgi:hypothetical protein